MNSSSGQCPRCKRPNQCAFSLNLPPEKCWCMASIQPAGNPSEKKEALLMPVPEKPIECYCPQCLAELKELQKIKPRKIAGPTD